MDCGGLDALLQMVGGFAKRRPCCEKGALCVDGLLDLLRAQGLGLLCETMTPAALGIIIQFDGHSPRSAPQSDRAAVLAAQLQREIPAITHALCVQVLDVLDREAARGHRLGAHWAFCCLWFSLVSVFVLS